MVEGETDIASIAAEQRARNAQHTTAAICLLMVLSIGASYVTSGPPIVLVIMAATALGLAFAFWLTRSGHARAGVLSAVALVLAQHVTFVAVLDGMLSTIPYIAPLAILLVAATANSRTLWFALALTLAALGAEGWLSHWTREDQGVITTASLFALMVFVISYLHVRSTEKAFEVANARELARVEALQAASESHRLYRLIADNTDDLVSLSTPSGEVLYASPSHERILGIDPHKTPEPSLDPLLTQDGRDTLKAAFSRALEEGESQMEVRVRSAQGDILCLDTLMQRVEAGPDVLIAIISRDMTEQKRLQDRLIASERFEALGRLAGSVAHDFNNLLTIIGGAAELGKSGLTEGDQVQLELDAILDASETASRLTRQLLTFSRQQVTVPIDLDLKTSLTSQKELLVRMAGPLIHVVYELAEGLPAVRMPASHFEQLAMNLSVNAKDAMPNGGKLTFGLERVTLEAGKFGVPEAGDYVVFSVRDQGVGIPDDVLKHLFEPSFTTKRTGTGLGLATCKSIVTQQGGVIDLETQTGRGTTFRIFLPASTHPREEREPQLKPKHMVHVLVVDDEDAVRETTARMLRTHGFQVRQAASLAQARALIEDASAAVDAIVTDVVLSNERGTDLLSDFRRHRGDAPIVVMSGYTADPDAASILEAHQATFLAKPFNGEQLLRALGVDSRSTRA